MKEEKEAGEYGRQDGARVLYRRRHCEVVNFKLQAPSRRCLALELIL
jgi:hypothetical protein